MSDGRKMSLWLNDRWIEEPCPEPAMRAVAWLRGQRRLTGTKVGCQEGDCGACAILLGEPAGANGGVPRYRAVLSCILPLAELAGRHVVTIEGLSLAGGRLSLVARTMKEFGAVQCGFCSPGFVLALTSGLLTEGAVTRDSLVCAAEGNICRCTGYRSILGAIHALADRFGAQLSQLSGRERIVRLTELGALPPYFSQVAGQVPVTSQPSVWMAKDAIVVGGGTDLLVSQGWDALSAGRGEPLLLSRMEGLQGVGEEGEMIVVGAAAKMDLLASSPLVGRIFAPGLALVASEPIRRQASVAGNIVNASPIGDLTIMLLALGADLVLKDHAGKQRTMKLAKFFLDYRKTALKRCEIVTQIRFKRLAESTARELFHFEKVSTRRYLDIAAVNSAIRLTIDAGVILSATVSAGGVAPTPLLLHKCAAHLTGKPLSAALVGEAAMLAMQEIQPISDVRGSAAYKRHLVGRLVKAHFVELFAHDDHLVRELTHEN